MPEKTPLYVAFDVEAAGRNPLRHATLSLGACVVTFDEGAKPRPFEERVARGEVFYTEIAPRSLDFQLEAMRVGCLHLECLERAWLQDNRYNPSDPQFDPALVLKHMQRVCERKGVDRLREWLEDHAQGREIYGVVDTTFFDPIRVENELALAYPEGSALSYKGLDLYSMLRGYAMGCEDLPSAEQTSLSTFAKQYIYLADWRTKPHKADQDAAYTADIARMLIGLERLGW